jgi:pimeloyl-ACP methyl ester carboxylesterase
MDEIGVPLPEDSKYTKPTLFIRGENSNYILDSDFENIKNHFPNADFATILNVGHWLHAENPQLFYELSHTFLKTN